MEIDLNEMEASSKFLPPKLQTVANSIRKGIEILEKGGRLRYARKKVKDALECRPFVSDGEILGILQDKLTILERENIFDGNKFDSGYERDLQTNDGDRIIFIDFHRKREGHEMDMLPNTSIIPKDDKEEDNKDEYVMIPGTKTKVKNDKFVARLKEKQRQEGIQEKEGTENKTESEN